MEAYKVRDWRKATGMTQEGLSERSGLHRVLIARYESGEVAPRLANARKLADGLGISVFELRQLPSVAYGLASVAEGSAVLRY